MKKIIFVCIILSVCWGGAMSAGILPANSELGSKAVVGLPVNQLVESSAVDTADVVNSAKRIQPIEPAVMFLFGIGIIGIITVHRLKFR